MTSRKPLGKLTREQLQHAASRLGHIAQKQTPEAAALAESGDFNYYRFQLNPKTGKREGELEKALGVPFLTFL